MSLTSLWKSQKDELRDVKKKFTLRLKGGEQSVDLTKYLI
jgi:hypothetical protein